jgi:hypothetical protein
LGKNRKFLHFKDLEFQDEGVPDVLGKGNLEMILKQA